LFIGFFKIWTLWKRQLFFSLLKSFFFYFLLFRFCFCSHFCHFWEKCDSYFLDLIYSIFISISFVIQRKIIIYFIFRIYLIVLSILVYFGSHANGYLLLGHRVYKKIYNIYIEKYISSFVIFYFFIVLCKNNNLFQYELLD